MNFPIFIAKRYLFSKNNSNAVNIISIISTLGFAIGSFALITILSVFNGFENLVFSLYNTFDPDIRIEAYEGKTFDLKKVSYDQIKNMPAVVSAAPVIEENAYLTYGDKQTIGFIKCTSEEFLKESGLDSLVVEGYTRLQKGAEQFAMVGYGISRILAINLSNDFNKLGIVVPRREGMNMLNPDAGYKKEYVFCSGIFSVDDEINGKYVLLPYEFGRTLLDYTPGTVTALELRLQKGEDINDFADKLREMLPADMVIKTKYELQEVLFRVFNSERWVVTFMLIFVICIAAFNVVGSLSMMVIEKRRDILILQTMGASIGSIRRIFINNGIMLSVAGGIAGMLLGLILCYLQMEFGFIKISGDGLNTLIVSEYPIKIKGRDIVLVLASNLVLGLLVSVIPSRIKLSQNFSEKN